MEERFGSGWKMCDIVILLFDCFWKRNLGSTSFWGRVGRGEMREEREFGWIHDLVRNILYFYSAQIKISTKKKKKTLQIKSMFDHIPEVGFVRMF